MTGNEPRPWHPEWWWRGSYEDTYPDIDGQSTQDRRSTPVDPFDRQKFEHELIDRKINWMVASQSLLLAAYGVAMSIVTDPAKDDSVAIRLGYIIGGVGIILALLTLLGIRVHQISKYHAWKQQQRYDYESQWGVVTTNTMTGIVLDALYPVVFLVAWIAILIGSAIGN